MKNQIINVTDSTFVNNVEKSDLPVLVEFFANWCNLSKKLSPAIESLSEEYSGKVKFVKINVDDSPEVSEKFGISGIPALLMFNQGFPIDQVIGVVPKLKIVNMISKSLLKTDFFTEEEIKISDFIIEPLKNTDNDFIYRRYNTFLDYFGMTKKRNFDVLNKVDKHLKEKNISIWNKNQEYDSVIDFKRGDTITFRVTEKEFKTDKLPFENLGLKEEKNKNAGTISIVNEDSGLILYKHQEEAIENLNNKIIKTKKNPFSGLLVLPTGGGKTLTVAYWIAKNLLDKNKKVLWIAHRHELLEQAKSTFHKLIAFRDIFNKIDSFNYRLISGIHDKPVNIKSTDNLIISSKDSLNSGFDYLYDNWLKDNKEEVFLVIDEAHHSTAKTYRKLINNLKDKVSKFSMIGLTATPFRTAEAEQGLLGKVFPDNIIYKIDLRTLISRGILSEPIFEELKTNFNMSNVLSEKELDNLKYFDIDSIGKETAKTIAENNERNWFIVNRYLENKSRYKQTLVFALNQDNAIALNALFKQSGIKSDFVLSSISDKVTGVNISSKDNKDKIEKFRNGELEVLINVNILTEGTDLPKIQTIFLTRPTISPILMTQMIGRGLRGEKAGGTRESFIVSFIDNWKDKVSWVNPEKLLIEENIDFKDRDSKTVSNMLRLISINKIEEFAILANKIIDIETKKELEKLDFIKRIPIGIYYFSFLKKLDNGNDLEKNHEVLVYDNVSQSYQDFINSLEGFFEKNNLKNKDFFTEEELTILCENIENDFFYGCEKYPSYRKEDIKDILNYYLEYESEPKYFELKDRSNFDIDKVALEIYNKDLGPKSKAEFTTLLWESSENEWKVFFGYDERNFLNEIDFSINRISKPKIYKSNKVIPEDTKELRKLESMSMSDIRSYNPQYAKYLSDNVYNKYKNEEGFYVSASKNYKSKNKLDFQIDHIKPISDGGLTILDNLQLLTRKENAFKGSKK